MGDGLAVALSELDVFVVFVVEVVDGAGGGVAGGLWSGFFGHVGVSTATD